MTSAPPELVRRYGPDDLAAFTEEERARFLGPLDGASWEAVGPAVGWELLYRREPELYDRLVSGERLHPGILAWLPRHVGTAVEVGAGTGRLTLQLAPRCERLTAVEPAEPMRAVLSDRLRERALADRVEVVDGFFERLPVPDGGADLVIACSSFTVLPGHGSEAGLAEMLRACRPGGLVVVVWADDPAWLVARGFQHVVFPGEMAVEFRDAAEALELARVFAPGAVGWIERTGSRRVPYEVLGTNPPRELCWRRA
ncbi:MAG TPA: class I SAM-dependent methyltransferase [Actinomycetota bacterium]|nr:class I SAM-dependent methyltransferase [Actinomycetota bacterium]